MASTGSKIKVGVAVGLFLVAGGWAYLQLRDKDVVGSSMTLFDVKTGAIVSVDRESLIGYPAKNPATGEWTCLPYERHEDGSLWIRERYRPHLQDLGDDVVFVEKETLRISKTE